MTKRKKKFTKPKSSTRSDAPMPAFRSFEKVFAGFGGGPPSDTPLDRAQALIYQAWDIPNPAKRIALARQALAICADCADAYLLLVEEQPQTLEEALEVFEQAVAAGERALGAETFKEDAGHFWGLHETRPYMRARQQLAMALWEFGDRSAAIAHAQDMLRLNPNDNQGMRQALLSWWLHVGNLPEARALWNQYEEDSMAWWSWSRALMAYIEHGDGAEANTYMDNALHDNRHVPSLLLGRESLPVEQPEYVGIGDAAEAAAYALDNLDIWKQTDGALRWLSRAVPVKRET